MSPYKRSPSTFLRIIYQLTFCPNGLNTLRSRQVNYIHVNTSLIFIDFKTVKFMNSSTYILNFYILLFCQIVFNAGTPFKFIYIYCLTKQTRRLIYVIHINILLKFAFIWTYPKKNHTVIKVYLCKLSLVFIDFMTSFK